MVRALCERVGRTLTSLPLPLHPPKIFISAPSGDLRSIRQIFKEGLLTINCHPVEQTNFEPEARTVENMLRGKIGDCQALIHICGMWYGAEPEVATLPPGIPGRGNLNCAEGRRKREWPQSGIGFRCCRLRNLQRDVMNESPALTHSFKEFPSPARSRMARRFPLFARLSMAGVMFFTMSFVAEAGWFTPTPDFTNHEVPLYQQITRRIQDKILTRLGDEKNMRDRYFIIPFAYGNRGNDAGYSHSFMTVIRVLADHKQVRLTAWLKKRTFKDRLFEAFTISWLPRDFAADPNLCVFKGFGSRLIPSWNRCPLDDGRSFTLEETMNLAVNVKNAVCMWGPYEISKEGFDVAVSRLRLLEKGAIKYRADDRITRNERTAINCFHAMAGLTEIYPDGGIFGTGFKVWGINGTARVLNEYEVRADLRGMLLEPVNEKEDRYGFVYAVSPESRYYNPFKASSAYCR